MTSDRAAVEDLRDRWEQRLEQDGWHGGPIPIIESPAETTWIWSDLHVGDRSSLEAFDRPFADVAAMNAHLLRTWRQRVRAEETIICRGDVAHPDAWRDGHLVADLRSLPGQAAARARQPRPRRRGAARGGVHEPVSLALCATDPPLALSHEPLGQLPGLGVVNVHGHLHEGTEPTRRHINVALEQTGYEPVRLSTVLAEARRRLVRRGGER